MVIDRAHRGTLDDARIEAALQAMKSSWLNLVELSDETHLILD